MDGEWKEREENIIEMIISNFFKNLTKTFSKKKTTSHWKKISL